jgi:hypothetical protein
MPSSRNLAAVLTGGAATTFWISDEAELTLGECMSTACACSGRPTIICCAW